MSHNRKPHGNNPPQYRNKPNYGKESYFEPKHTSSKKTHEYSGLELTLSSRIALVSFTILLLTSAAAAERNKITFSHRANNGNGANAEIKHPEIRIYDVPGGFLGDQHVVNMELINNSSKLSANCLRTSELGCRIDGADQGHTFGLRSTHYATINPNLDHDGPYPNHPTYAVTHHYQCSGEGDLSTFDVLDPSSRTNFILTGNPHGVEFIVKHGGHEVVKEPSSNLLLPSDGSIRANIVERRDPKTSEIDRSISLTMKKDYMSVSVNVQHIKENEGVRIHAIQQGGSISVQASSLQDHELEFPSLKTAYGCRSSKPPIQTQQSSKHMQLFYTPKRDTTEVELTSDMGITKASYPKKLI